MALRSHLIARESDFPQALVDIYCIHPFAFSGCHALCHRHIHRRVEVFIVFLTFFFFMWQKTFAASVSTCCRSFLLFQTVSCAKESKQAESKGLICSGPPTTGVF